MRLPGYLVAFVLTLLLAGTTSVGTGAGVHQFDLLHPLFSHLHLVNGRLLTHEQMAAEAAAAASTTPPVQGVAFGANGAGAADGGLGTSPTVPRQAPMVIWESTWRWDAFQIETVPIGREDAPPDPPPL
ncbi:MAG: hypothetical protein JO057_02390 [Chloroflexi bacterium]|nr:hypothetical protein [Chloroflexota bacterium]